MLKLKNGSVKILGFSKTQHDNTVALMELLRGAQTLDLTQRHLGSTHISEEQGLWCVVLCCVVLCWDFFSCYVVVARFVLFCWFCRVLFCLLCCVVLCCVVLCCVVIEVYFS